MNMFVLPASLYLTCTGDIRSILQEEKRIVGSAVVQCSDFATIVCILLSIRDAFD